MKQIKSKQQIRTTMDKYSPVITVNTAESYALEYNKTFSMENFIAKEKKFGRDYRYSFAWTNQMGTMLTANYPGKEKEFELRAERYAKAVLIEDGEIIEIDGRKFKVIYMGINYCDPVHFELIEN